MYTIDMLCFTNTVQPKRHDSFLLKGIRILGKFSITDSEEAQGLSHYLSNVDIYSNSWGPPDGTGFTGPGSVTKAALLDGVTNVSSHFVLFCVVWLCLIDILFRFK